MKNMLLALVISIAVMSVSCSTPAINFDDVSIDSISSPSIYTYKSNGGKITGVIVNYDIDSITGKKYVSRKREVVDGIKVNVLYDYAPNGQIILEYPHKNGRVSGLAKKYYDNGSLLAEFYMENDTINGIGKEYGEDGCSYSKG